MMDDRAEFLAAYRSELMYLREAGQGFARRHPKVAERLELSTDGSSDPHVERLIEAFAFLTARIQRRVDAELPEFTSALLGVLYPNLANPIPPMSIARLVADRGRRELESGYEVPRKTALFSQTVDGLSCRFQTAYPVKLWPIEVLDAGLISKSNFDFLDNSSRVASVLRVQLAAKGPSFTRMKLDRLRFYLYGDSYLTGRLYELLFDHCLGVALYDPETHRAVRLPRESLRQVGFAADEEVIPYPPQAHPGYRLLQEYFWLPEKFLFVDLLNLNLNTSETSLEILFLLDVEQRQRLAISRNTFALGCTPIINLFNRTSEPIRVDHTKTEYRLVPDQRRERTMEVHSVRSVSDSTNPAQESRFLRPLYAFGGVGSANGEKAAGEKHAYWYARRAFTERADMSGTDVYLSFVDMAFNPAEPPANTAYAHLLCTNRDLASQLPENALLQTEEPGPIGHIHCLRKPTVTGYPPLGGSSRWALISNLSLNYLSLGEDAASLDAFRKILQLYSLSGAAEIQQQINGIRAMSSRTITRRIGGSSWKHFCQGYQVRLTFDEDCFTAQSAYLFASVLQQFLSLHSGINSFTELAIGSVQRRGEWKRLASMQT